MDFHFSDFKVLDVPEQHHLIDKIRGDNKKSTLIVFQSEQQDEELVGFLGKVLAAVQLDLTKDVATLKLTPQDQISFVGIRKQIPIQCLISFGVAPQRMGIRFEPKFYQPFQHEDTTFLFADDLQKIYEERQNGGKRMSGELWRALKAIFLP